MAIVFFILLHSAMFVCIASHLMFFFVAILFRFFSDDYIVVVTDLWFRCTTKNKATKKDSTRKSNIKRSLQNLMKILTIFGILKRISIACANERRREEDEEKKTHQTQNRTEKQKQTLVNFCFPFAAFHDKEKIFARPRYHVCTETTGCMRKFLNGWCTIGQTVSLSTVYLFI